MKKLFVLLFAVFFKTILLAQTPANVGGIEPPTAVSDQFVKHHPAVTPNWSKEGQDYKAIYEDPNSGKGVLIVYDKKGEVIRTENEMDNKAYPKTIHEYYTKTYPEEQYKLWSAQDKTGVTSYYVNRDNNEILWFDKDGNFIKKTSR